MNDRDLHLDFVKGVLVFIMVIYHTMNYFSTAEPYYYSFIRFITGSFIFISGYIISTVYENKYAHIEKKACKRLFIRGVKLLLLVTCLNLLINLLGIANYKNIDHNLNTYLMDLSTIYISGNSKVTAFPILIPIAYLLIISPVYFVFHDFRKLIVLVTFVWAIFCSYLDIDSYNISLVTLGLLGLSAGILITKEKLISINNRLIAFFLLIIVISTMGFLSSNILTYAFGIFVLINLIYDFSKKIDLKGVINKYIILFGQYSLVCYIMQILFLFGLYQVFSKQRWGFGYETVSIVLATNFFLVAMCLVLNFFRGRYKLINKTYRLILQ